MKIKPHFVQNGQNAENLFNWKKVDCEIKDSQGQVYFLMKGVEAPKDWGQLAIEIAASKYFRKTDIYPRKKSENSEKSIRQMVSRVVKAITKSGIEQKYFNAASGKIFAQELTFILLSQRAFFNSPVWFNCGLYEAYKIKGDSPNWAWNKQRKKIELIGSSYLRPQIAACFIQKVEDNLDSIFDLAKNEARLFKFGSGSGTNFSTLRSKYEKLQGGGTSSGLISFLDVLDRGAASIKSGGITRRAAKMVCLDIDHPEIIEFINWKSNEEKKAKVLITAGYDADYEGEAYRTVSGQNANNSVRVTDRFMLAVKENKNWSLLARTNQKIIKKVPARDLWNQICKAAYDCADPGLQFHDTINHWHTCPKAGEIRASNPCSEYMFLDDSACNLASINLLKFQGIDGVFDFESYLHTTRIMFIAQEILVDYAGYPTEKIAENSHTYRPLGIGFCGLGALLMRRALGYDSDESRAWGGFLTSLLMGQAQLTSCELAEVKGSFIGFKKNKKEFIQVLRKHQSYVKKIPPQYFSFDQNKLLKEIWHKVLEKSSLTGIRNAQATALAPTGTIGLVMDCDTTGIEPEFSLVKYKKLSGGGDKKIISTSIKPALFKLGYSQPQIQEILDYIEVHETIEGSALKKEHLSVFDSANKNGNLGERHLSSEAHLQMMAAVQPFLSGAISKTVNLPTESTVEDISHIYNQAWKLGLKAISIYRDNSKGSQPLKNRPRKWHGDPTGQPRCPDCGSPTELAGGCFRCVNCGTTIGCA